MNPESEFIKILCNDVHRDGTANLIKWLQSTDFFTAPASTRYHGAFEGGLAIHSLNVYAQLKMLCKWYKCDASPESIAIVSLFHDLCKIGCYKTEMRWRKDANNQWEQYATWKHEEDFAYGGHGSKSVYLAQSFITLTPEEASAINCHMGQYDATIYSNPSEVYSRNKLAWLLHVADEAATYVIEDRKETK